MRKAISILLTIAILCSIAAAVFFLFISSTSNEVKKSNDEKMAEVRAAKAAKKYESEAVKEKTDDEI